MKPRRLLVVLGDQLNSDSALFDDADPARDLVWMAEVSEESTHVPSHKLRIALFLSAMRHFRDELRGGGWRVDYRPLDAADNRGSLESELRAAVARHQPDRVLVVEPGEHRVREALRRACPELGILADRHFLCSTSEFARYAGSRSQLRLEYFYREMRRRHGVLMEDGRPAGGNWNFDAENRAAFGRSGPGLVPPPAGFPPDETTREVLRLVESRFPRHPGGTARFDWPVTREQALAALGDFAANRLPYFGLHQDAMWTGEPFLFHSRLSSSLNLKLLDPRETLRAAEDACRAGAAPLAAAEGFIRQVLGWREYVRGIYWRFMPEYLRRNELQAHEPLPGFYWTGDTEMNCLRNAIGQTLEHGYAHHIQRLMVTGLYALLLGVEPVQVHEWYLAVYVDAVEWVELPNTIGMSQFADGGRMASKPYAATGRYIERMSNYCEGCRYRPAEATGEQACPFTTLYWDFLLRNRERLERVPRMNMQLRNLDRLTDTRRREIRRQADRWKSRT